MDKGAKSKTLNLSEKKKEGGKAMQAQIVQRMELGVKRTLEEFGINAQEGSQTDFDFILAANQILQKGQNESVADKSNKEASLARTGTANIAIELKRQQVNIYQQLQSQLTKQLLNKNTQFHQKLQNRREQKIQRKVKAQDLRKEAYTKLKSDCHSKLPEDIDQHLILKIYPADSDSRIQAKKFALKRMKKGAVLSSNQTMFADHVEIEMQNPVTVDLEDDITFMKLFTVRDVVKLMKKNWMIENSSKFEVQLKFCKSYADFIMHTQQRFQLLENLNPSDTYMNKLSEDDMDLSIPEMAVMSGIYSDDQKKVIQLFYEIVRSEDGQRVSNCPPLNENQDIKKEEGQKERSSSSKLSSSSMFQSSQHSQRSDFWSFNDELSNKDIQDITTNNSQKQSPQDPLKKLNKKVDRFQKYQKEMVYRMHTKKEIVDVIINILQILTLKSGKKQLENKINNGGESEGDAEDSDSQIFNDQREISRLKKMLFETQRVRNGDDVLQSQADNSIMSGGPNNVRGDQISNFEDSYLPNNFDFEHSINTPFIQTSDLKQQNHSSLMYMPADVKRFEQGETPEKKQNQDINQNPNKQQKKLPMKKIVPVMIEEHALQNMPYQQRDNTNDHIKKVDTSTKTYSFCEKKSKTKAGVTVLMPNATRAGKNLACQLSEKMSSIYAAAPGISPTLRAAGNEGVDSNPNMTSSQEMAGTQFQNQQSMQILESMDTIIKNSKKGVPFQNVPNPNQGLTNVGGENSQFSNNSAFQVFDPNKRSSKVQIENEQKSHNFTSFTQYFDNNRRDENVQQEEHREYGLQKKSDQGTQDIDEHPRVLMTPYNNGNNSNSLIDLYGNNNRGQELSSNLGGFKDKNIGRNNLFGESSLLGLPGHSVQKIQNIVQSPISNRDFLDNPEINLKSFKSKFKKDQMNMQTSPLNNRQQYLHHASDGKSLIPYDKNDYSYQPEDFEYSMEPLDPLGEAIRNIELRHTFNSKRNHLNATPPRKQRILQKNERVKQRTQNQTADFNAETYEAINYNLNKLDDRENPIDCLSAGHSEDLNNQKYSNIKPKPDSEKDQGQLLGEGKIPHPSKVFDMFFIQQKQEQQRHQQQMYANWYHNHK